MGQIVIPLAFKCSINLRYHFRTERVVASQHPTVYVERRCTLGKRLEKKVTYLLTSQIPLDISFCAFGRFSLTVHAKLNQQIVHCVSKIELQF